MAGRTVKKIIEQGRKLPKKDREEIISALNKINTDEKQRDAEAGDPTLSTAGAWKDLVDCEKLLEDIFASRKIPSIKED